MANTLRQYAREMIRWEPSLGQIVPITSLTTTTIVSNLLAVGTLSAGRQINKWLLRRDVASPNQAADRVRVCSNYAAASGTLTHAGAAYADTTATDEFVEILELEPRLIDEAINATLARLRFEDRTILPTHKSRNYGLGALDWLREASDVKRITHVANPVLSRNRYMDKWNAVSSAGLLEPDFWTLAGTSGVWARTTANLYGTARFSLRVTRAGTNLTVRQTPGLLSVGVAADDLQGETVQVVAVVYSAVASQVRAQLLDGVTTTNSSYHTGDSTWQELSTAATAVGAAGTTLQFGLSIEGDNTAVDVAQLYLVHNAVTDAVRRDNYTEREFLPEWAQDGALRITAPYTGFGGQLAVYSHRAYPQFDATRLRNGTADGDTSDAPLRCTAEGALAHLYKEIALSSTGTAADMAKAERHERIFRQMAASHLLEADNPNVPGIDLPMAPIGGRYRSRSR